MTDRYNMNSSKMLWHMDRVHEWQKGKRIVPLFIDIGATKKCNVKCRFCYGAYQKMTGEIIPSDVLCNLLRDAPNLGVKGMTFTGDGEPTLNPALYDAVQIGKENGLDIAVATNGLKLDDLQIYILLRNLTWLRFTICSADKENYKFMHGVDAFDLVTKHIALATAIKQQLKADTTIGMQMVLTPDCFNQILPLSRLAIDLGVDYLQIKQFSDPGDEKMYRFDFEKYDQVTDSLKAAEAMSTDQTDIIIKWSMINNKGGDRKYDHCIDLPFLFQVSGNSRCYPCGFLFNHERYCYGDLKKHSLEEIITSERYWEIIDHMATEFNVHGACMGNCRHDFINEFLTNYVNPPKHLNFI